MIWRTATDSSGSVTSIGQTACEGDSLAVAAWCELFLFCVPPSDLRAEEDRGVHLPHGLLRQHRHRAVGRSDHL